MILFLDTVSSLPEFSIIEDNKIIYSEKILKNFEEKMSDCIIPCYIGLEKKYTLDSNLKSIIVNTGPGSYTALRVGIAFLLGLSVSRNIFLKGVSCTDLFKHQIKSQDVISTAILINSSNNQKFICIYNEIKKDYNVHKIEKNINFLSLSKNPIKKILTNENINFKDLTYLKNINNNKIDFNYLVVKNLIKILNIPKQNIIEPIYISNNKILN